MRNDNLDLKFTKLNIVGIMYGDAKYGDIEYVNDEYLVNIFKLLEKYLMSL